MLKRMRAMLSVTGLPDAVSQGSNLESSETWVTLSFGTLQVAVFGVEAQEVEGRCVRLNATLEAQGWVAAGGATVLQAPAAEASAAAASPRPQGPPPSSRPAQVEPSPTPPSSADKPAAAATGTSERGGLRVVPVASTARGSAASSASPFARLSQSGPKSTTGPARPPSDGAAKAGRKPFDPNAPTPDFGDVPF